MQIKIQTEERPLCERFTRQRLILTHNTTPAQYQELIAARDLARALLHPKDWIYALAVLMHGTDLEMPLLVAQIIQAQGPAERGQVAPKGKMRVPAKEDFTRKGYGRSVVQLHQPACDVVSVPDERRAAYITRQERAINKIENRSVGVERKKLNARQKALKAARIALGG